MSITAAIAIADALGIDEWLKKKLGKSNNDAAKVASKFIDLAVTKSGVKNPDDILYKIEENPVLAAQLKTLMLDNAQALAMAPYQERKDARDMYEVNSKQAEKIADHIVIYNNVYIAFYLVVLGLVMYFIKDNAAVSAPVSSLITIIIKSKLDEQMQITGFYFGSSLGSKLKNIIGKTNND